ADRGSVGADPKFLDQQDFVAIDWWRIGFIDDQGKRARWMPDVASEQSEVAKQRAGMPQRDCNACRGAACERALARQRFGQGDAIEPVPVDRGGHLKLILEGDFNGGAKLEPERRGRADQRRDRRFQLTGSKRKRATFRLQPDGFAGWRGRNRRLSGAQRGEAQSADERAPAGEQIPVCHKADADHFWTGMSSGSPSVKRSHFFAAKG